MNISREPIEEQMATIRIEITPDDYTEKVAKVLKDYQRKANLPGFRPGHVPFGMVKKMYGKAAIADEVNKILTDTLSDYIRDEKLNILGNPLPNKEKTKPIGFDEGETMEFFFDIGFAPEFDLKLDSSVSVDHYEILVDDKMIDKYIEESRKRVAGEGELPELNTEFFEKVYPGEKIESTDELRERIRKDYNASFVPEADKILYSDITETLSKNTTITFPDSFMKRWLYENNEQKMTEEEVEKQYPAFAESMKWQMIENKIIRDYQVTVSDEDIRGYIRQRMFQHINTENQDDEMRKRYESIVDALMQNKEQVQRINDQLYNEKLLTLFRDHLTINKKEISYDDFVTMISSKHMHEYHHEHEGHDDHEHHDHHDHHDHNH